jgi:ubiquinone/menaquinone biosynthesis C-methylase UbiE
MRMFQGAQTSRVFNGQGESAASRLMYNESTKLFSELIRQRLTSCSYSIADFGSFKGEFLSSLLAELKEYSFQSTGIDINASALAENTTVDRRIASDVASTPLQANSMDVSICRYVLMWNTFDKQKKILDELVRTTRSIVIVQNACADNVNTDVWRHNFSKLFDGQMSKLNREDYFFASRQEIETYLTEQGVRFERVQERRVENILDIFKERFGLDNAEYETGKKLLGNMNYLIQNSWVIYPGNSQRGSGGAK